MRPVTGMMVPVLRQRRSPRLAAAAVSSSRTSSSGIESDGNSSEEKKPRPNGSKRTKGNEKKRNSAATKVTSKKRKASTTATGLARNLEFERRNQNNHQITRIIGIDEAGRGPLAGPVVAAAVIMNDLPAAGDKNVTTTSMMDGIQDSKKITNEVHREELYTQIVECDSRNEWAVAVIDAAKIDEINILQATLLGMRLAAQAVMGKSFLPDDIPVHDHVSSQHSGCYVVVPNNHKCSDSNVPLAAMNDFYALIDGNRVPSEMPCPAEAVIRGDGSEYCIAAASILAKVSRDRIMKEYDALFPEYQLGQNKGYPTAAHMQLVHLHGASPIHRRSFAPLKSMNLDPETGKVLS